MVYVVGGYTARWEGNPGKLERDDGDKDLWRVALLAPARYGSCKIPETLTCVEINLLARNSRCHHLQSCHNSCSRDVYYMCKK